METEINMTRDEAIITAMDMVDNTVVIKQSYTELLSAIGQLMDDDPHNTYTLAKIVRIGELMSGRIIHDVYQYGDWDYGKNPIDMLAGSLYWGAGIIEWHPDHLAELAFTELVKCLEKP
jgi:hypothetical protein